MCTYIYIYIYYNASSLRIEIRVARVASCGSSSVLRLKLQLPREQTQENVTFGDDDLIGASSHGGSFCSKYVCYFMLACKSLLDWSLV